MDRPGRAEIDSTAHFRGFLESIDHMEYLVVLAVASAVSLAVIPIAVALAPRWGLIDKPDSRKVHARPVPRVGGIGIVTGTISGIALLLPLNELVTSYLIGAAILATFGAWDDRSALGHYSKFLGQMLAIVPIVTWGGLYITHFPFLDSPLPPVLGIPFTAFALIGMINATNHSDGLDGLAGGETVLSLVGIGLLALHAGDGAIPLMAVAATGALAGFLRHNNHPATLFMGDSGSQFLGFTLGVLAILLTQRADSSLSPAVVLLLLGLPIADILAVFYLRIRGGMNWFRATRNHIHHRLLDLGLSQHSAVLTIYAVQATMVATGILLRKQPDSVVVSVYLTFCALLFGGLCIAERRKTPTQSQPHSRSGPVWLASTSRRLVAVTVPTYLIGLAVTSTLPRYEIALLCLAVAILLPAEPLLNGGSARSILSRALMYMVVTLIVYASVLESSGGFSDITDVFLLTLIGVSVIAATLSSPRQRRFEFQLTTADFLVLSSVTAIVGLGLAGFQFATYPFLEFVVKLVLLLYGAELLLVEQRGRSASFQLLLCAGAGVIVGTGSLL